LAVCCAITRACGYSSAGGYGNDIKTAGKNAIHPERSDRVPINYLSSPGIDWKLKAHSKLRRGPGIDFRGVGAPTSDRGFMTRCRAKE
jgi:hypothetical protein